MKILLSLLTFIALLPLGLQSQTNNDTLNIGYYESPPFIYKDGDGKLTGISIWMWEVMYEELNFPYKMHYIPLNQVMKELDNGNIDICLNPLTLTSERFKQSDFTYPFFVSNATAAVQEISAIKKSRIILASFFSANFFKAVFALFLIILVFGFLVWIFERKKNPEQFHPKAHGLMSGIWWSAVTMTTVGYGDKSPQTFWGRIVALIWMFTAVIILSGFTASIASSLTINHLNWNKNSIMEFKKSPVGVIDGSATKTWLVKSFFEKIESFNSIPEGLEALKNDQIKAFIHDEPILRYYIQEAEDENDIEILPAKFNLQFYSFGLSKKMDEEKKDKMIQLLLQITEHSDWQVLLSEYDLTIQ